MPRNVGEVKHGPRLRFCGAASAEDTYVGSVFFPLRSEVARESSAPFRAVQILRWRQGFEDAPTFSSDVRVSAQTRLSRDKSRIWARKRWKHTATSPGADGPRLAQSTRV